MNFERFLDAVGALPIIDSGTLAVLDDDRASLAVQITRWTSAGKLEKLGRGLYLLAERYRLVTPCREYIANVLRRPSYVSLQRALSIHGMIPESVPLVQSVTTSRPGTVNTGLGSYDYRHVKPSWFTGYAVMTIAGGQSALVATAEKALLDLVYLSHGEFTVERIEELRLDDTQRLDRARLMELARLSGSPRVEAAAGRIIDFASS